MTMVSDLNRRVPRTISQTEMRLINRSAVVEYLRLVDHASRTQISCVLGISKPTVMRIINQAKKPVMTIKPLAAGRLLPVVGLSFVWSTIRDQDMVTIGTTTPDEAREIIDISLQLLERRTPEYELQATRSKSSLQTAAG